METNKLTEQNKSCSTHTKKKELKNGSRGWSEPYTSPQTLPPFHHKLWCVPGSIFTSCVSLWVEEMLLMGKAQLGFVWWPEKLTFQSSSPCSSRGCTCFFTLPHSRRNCPQSPMWTQRGQGSLANKNCWFSCLRLRTWVFAHRVAACGTDSTQLVKSNLLQNRKSLFSKG